MSGKIKKSDFWFSTGVLLLFILLVSFILYPGDMELKDIAFLAIPAYGGLLGGIFAYLMYVE